MYIYLTTNDNKNEPDILNYISYINVSSDGYGDYTLILTDTLINDPNVQITDQVTAQNTLNSWIDSANLSDNGTRPYINIDDFLVSGDILPVLQEKANLDRIQRGYATDSEKSQLLTLAGFTNLFPYLVQNMDALSIKIMYNNTCNLIIMNN